MNLNSLKLEKFKIETPDSLASAVDALSLPWINHSP